MVGACGKFYWKIQSDNPYGTWQDEVDNEGVTRCNCPKPVVAV